MDAPTLLKAIATDEASLDSLRPWLWVASEIVIIGLIIEFWPDSRKLHWWHWDSDLFMEIIGSAIVTIAIAAELGVTILSSNAETTLRIDNGRYIYLLEKEASDANLKAEQLKADNLELERIMTPRHWLDPSIRGTATLEKSFQEADLWEH